ncbi:MAG: tRNA (guanosine(46)-N7)-methyltransferase TrmB [Pseudomonadota bacterium]
MTEAKHRRPIRSFVRREGRITKAQKQALETLWPLYGLTCHSGIAASWQNDIQNPVILEIGFGMGDSLVEMAKSNPDKNFIGVDVHRPGVGACLQSIHREQLTNLKLFCDDVNDVLNQAIPDQSLDVIQLFFPDPWPKQRHHKRRLIQVDFVKLLHQKLKPKGTLHIATDWKNYAEHIQRVVNASGLFLPLSAHDLSVVSLPRGDATSSIFLFRPTTKFEQRGKRLGHDIWDFIYRA